MKKNKLFNKFLIIMVAFCSSTLHSMQPEQKEPANFWAGIFNWWTTTKKEEAKNPPGIILRAIARVPKNKLEAIAPLPLPNLKQTCHANATWQILLYPTIKLRKQLVDCYMNDNEWNKAIAQFNDEQKNAATALAQLACIMEYTGSTDTNELKALDIKIKKTYPHASLWENEYNKQLNAIQQQTSDARSLSNRDLRNLFIVLHAMSTQGKLCKIGEQGDPNDWGIYKGLDQVLFKLNCFGSDFAKNLFAFQKITESMNRGNQKIITETSRQITAFVGSTNKKLLPFSGTFQILMAQDKKNYKILYYTHLPRYALVRINTQASFSNIPKKDLALYFEKTDEEKNVKFLPKKVYYDLVGVILHAGGKWHENKYVVRGGHYTAFVHDPATPIDAGDWYFCDDTEITKIKSETMSAKLKTGLKKEGLNNSDSCPMFLLYEKSDKKNQIVESPSSASTTTVNWEKFMNDLGLNIQ